jgi:hypothetical protein
MKCEVKCNFQYQESELFDAAKRSENKTLVGVFPENSNPVSRNRQCRLCTSIHHTVQTVTTASKCEYVPVQSLPN